MLKEYSVLKRLILWFITHRVSLAIPSGCKVDPRRDNKECHSHKNISIIVCTIQAAPRVADNDARFYETHASIFLYTKAPN
jgi:hypothetical protein